MQDASCLRLVETDSSRRFEAESNEANSGQVGPVNQLIFLFFYRSNAKNHGQDEIITLEAKSLSAASVDAAAGHGAELARGRDDGRHGHAGRRHEGPCSRNGINFNTVFFI